MFKVIAGKLLLPRPCQLCIESVPSGPFVVWGMSTVLIERDSPSTNVWMHSPPSIVLLSGQSTSVETTAVGRRKNPDDDKSN